MGVKNKPGAFIVSMEEIIWQEFSPAIIVPSLVVLKNQFAPQLMGLFWLTYSKCNAKKNND